VVDDGATVSIYFNDVLMCQVLLENPGVIYESDGTGQEYYGKATLRNASGKDVLTVENTRINSAGSQIALTTRSQTMEFANLYIAYKGQEAEGSRVETPLGGSTAEADYTPDQRLVTTLNLGKAPDYIGEETTPDSGNATTPSETTPEEGTPDGTTPAETQPQGKKGCKSVLALPALVTLLAAGYALTKRRD
jgi:hypothetical protein